MLRVVRAYLFYTVIFILLLSTQVQTQQSGNRRTTGSISGLVTVGGKPVSNALVTAEELSPEPGQEVKVLQGNKVEQHIFAKSKTDADGRYRITGLAEGRYSIQAMSRAYVSTGTRMQNGGSREVTLEDGEARENVDFEFVQGGVITGRVTDSEDRPVIASTIRLIWVGGKGQQS